MDTSETYVKQCDCPEVQGKWKPDYLFGSVLYGKFSKEIIACETNNLSGVVWLPRQDQIQEILLSDEDLKWNIPKLVGNFVPFFGSNKNYERFNSMEKLWLAFYMKEKHRKSWNGEKWIKK